MQHEKQKKKNREQWSFLRKTSFFLNFYQMFILASSKHGNIFTFLSYVYIGS